MHKMTKASRYRGHLSPNIPGRIFAIEINGKPVPVSPINIDQFFSAKTITILDPCREVLISAIPPETILYVEDCFNSLSDKGTITSKWVDDFGNRNKRG